jgi:predicted nucleic acid-binding protein
MFLVDTSVWIDYLREKDNSVTQYFALLLDQGTPFGITGVIYQEILQGASSKSDLDFLTKYLSTQRFYHIKDNINSYQSAAEIYFSCRRKGITIRSTMDCLIAQIAIENDLILLHNDEDYYRIATVIPVLKSYKTKFSYSP